MKTTGITIIVVAWVIYFNFPPAENILLAFVFLFLSGLGGGILGMGIGNDLAS